MVGTGLFRPLVAGFENSSGLVWVLAPLTPLIRFEFGSGPFLFVGPIHPYETSERHGGL